jgi:hypothetical protein
MGDTRGAARQGIIPTELRVKGLSVGADAGIADEPFSG